MLRQNWWCTQVSSLVLHCSLLCEHNKEKQQTFSPNLGSTDFKKKKKETKRKFYPCSNPDVFNPYPECHGISPQRASCTARETRQLTWAIRPWFLPLPRQSGHNHAANRRPHTFLQTSIPVFLQAVPIFGDN